MTDHSLLPPPPLPPPPDPPGDGPRPTRPNYVLRRTMVGVAAVLVVVGAALGIYQLSNDGDVSAGPAGPGTTEATGTSETTTTGAPAATTAPTTAAPVTTAPTTTPPPRHNDLTQPPTFPDRQPPVRAVADADPLRVWTIGDSTAQSIGELLASAVATTPTITARTVAKTSSGLTRPDFYDWPGALPGILADGPPDAVVVSFGANDAQPLQPQGSSIYVNVSNPEWSVEYTRRTADFVGQMTAAGSRVYLVGQPVMRDPGFSQRMGVIDAVYRTVAAGDPDVEYIDSTAYLADDDGAYTDELPGAGGEMVTVRSDDGIHLSLGGARWMARIIGRQVLADYGLQGP